MRFLLEKNDDSYCCLTTERSRMHPLNESTKMGSIPTNCRPTSIGPIFTRVSQGSTGSPSALIILFKFNLTWKSMKIQQKKMRSLSEELFYGILFSQNGIDRDRASPVYAKANDGYQVGIQRAYYRMIDFIASFISSILLPICLIVVQNEEIHEDMTNSNRRF